MNGKTDDDTLIRTALVGTSVNIVMGIVGDELTKPLSDTGAQNVIDRLRARGFEIVKR